jgi:putative nucleotidyltransferase with HDIG domain
MGGLYLLEPAGLRLTVARGQLEPFVGRLIQVGEGASGRAVERRRPVVVDDYQTWPDRAPLYRDVPVRSVIAAPIMWHQTVLGALHMEHQQPGRFGRQAIELVNLFADQAAVAIANARLFDDLERANVELAQAYDDTLEGWVRALDLRDQETEGHTQRVTEMTMRLAREMGVPEPELVHYRRGALLHDIGKIGIPDKILRKPGPLNDEEHAIMCTHPVLARNMLSPIPYLRPSLDIPFGHHERWDGTGYPQGLCGEDIPLAARVFSVVDVYDALRFDRPYRKAWDHVRVVDHVRRGAGTAFDPAVVEAFVRMLERDGAPPGPP